jgi:hypothetical protein
MVTKQTLYVLVVLDDLLRALWVAHRFAEAVVLHLAADHNVVRRR